MGSSLSKSSSEGGFDPMVWMYSCLRNFSKKEGDSGCFDLSLNQQVMPCRRLPEQELNN